MLSITAKIMKLKEELDSAIQIAKDLHNTLRYVNKGDLYDKVGVFAVQIPDWKILTDEKQDIVNFVRKTCTGELSLPDAITFAEKLVNEFESTRKLIKL